MMNLREHRILKQNRYARERMKEMRGAMGIIALFFYFFLTLFLAVPFFKAIMLSIIFDACVGAIFDISHRYKEHRYNLQHRAIIDMFITLNKLHINTTRKLHGS